MISWAYFSQVFMGVDVPIGNKERVRGAFYRGSRFLTPLADFMHVPLDQINYVVCGLLSISLGHLLMRRSLAPPKTSPHIRALVETILGLILVSFCFGNQLRVLLLQSTVAYLLMYFLPPSKPMAILVTLWSMFYMTLVHLCRLQYDYGGYTLDISGPVMVQTQRLSSLAFNLADGTLIRERKKQNTNQKAVSAPQSPSSPILISTTSSSVRSLGDDTASLPMECLKSMMMRFRNSFADNQYLTFTRRSSAFMNKFPVSAYATRSVSQSTPATAATDPVTQMSPNRIEHAIEQLPDVILFSAYTLNFHGVSVGPFVFFSDYLAYLRGYEKHRLPQVGWHHLINIFVRTTIVGLMSAYLSPFFPFEFTLTEDFASRSILYRILYSTIALFLVRQKYYFAWGLAEVNAISAGLGFSGFCPTTGQPIYLKVRNYITRHVEAGVNLKAVIDNWNMSTTYWLREVFYDRLPHSTRTWLVFIVSAFWHGFYPGYYLMFLTFALFTNVARVWRRTMRLLCRQTTWSSVLYDVFTTVVTSLAVNYAQAPFHLLDLSASLIFWKAFFFVPHVIAVILFFGHFIRPRMDPSGRYVKVASSHGRTVGG